MKVLLESLRPKTNIYHYETLIIRFTIFNFLDDVYWSVDHPYIHPDITILNYSARLTTWVTAHTKAVQYTAGILKLIIPL